MDQISFKILFQICKFIFYSQLEGHDSQFGNPMASSFKQFSFLRKSLGDLVFNRQQMSVEEPAYTSTTKPINEERGWEIIF